MNTHEFVVKDIFTLPENGFTLTTTTLLSLSLTPHVFSQAYHSGNLPLLLEPHQLLREVINRASNDFCLECFGGAVKNSLLEVFDESFLLLTLSCLFPLLSGSQLGDKIESLFFAFEHHVLLSASSNQPLQKDNGLLFLISALVLLKVFGPDDLSVRRSFWSDLNFAEEVIFLVLVVLDFLLLDSLIDGQLSPLKCSNMHVLLASHALFELEFNGVDTHALLKDFIWQCAREFLKALISRECFWLHLVFVGLLIK